MLFCVFYCLDRCIITEYRVCLCRSDDLQRHNNTATVYSFRHPVCSTDKGYISRWSLIIKTDQNNINLHYMYVSPCQACQTYMNIICIYSHIYNVPDSELSFFYEYNNINLHIHVCFLCLPCKINVYNKRFTSLLSLFTYNHACSNFCLCIFDS